MRRRLSFFCKVLLPAIACVLPVDAKPELVPWKRSSSQWSKNSRRIQSLEARLSQLPQIPMENLGGTGGYQSRPLNPETNPLDGVIEISIEWDEAADIDLVALVPARSYNDMGVELCYGMPEDFTVTLLNEQREEFYTVAEEHACWTEPNRQGLPFVYELKEPQRAKGAVIRSGKLHRFQATRDMAFFECLAWAEIFCLEGNTNRALKSHVTFSYTGRPLVHWLWRSDFLVDGLTPLGFPEVPDHAIFDVGWISHNGRIDDATWVQIDLEQMQRIDGVRLYPALRPLSQRIGGFGFPRRFRVLVSDEKETGRFRPVLDYTMHDIDNPGHNPVLFSFEPVSARYVRIEVLKRWSISEIYPAFAGFSEIEVLSGGSNAALSKECRVSEREQRIAAERELCWSPAGLTDGFGAAGRLLPLREWLLLLSERYGVEEELYHLRLANRRIEEEWKHLVSVLSVGSGVLGAVFLFILPVRYQIQKRRFAQHLRNQLAGELHDDVGSRLGSIKTLAEAALRQPHAYAEYVETIGSVAGDALVSTRNLSRMIRLNHPQADHWVERLRGIASSILVGQEWSLNVTKEVYNWVLDDIRQFHLTLFFREALHNIVRHANSSHVYIRIDRGVARNELSCVIEDDGKGLDFERLNDPLALRALKQRAKELNGHLKVEQRHSGGLRLKLVFKVNRRWTDRLLAGKDGSKKEDA